MDVKNSLAMKKKRELLGSLNKRKMSLRKYIDNLKQNECRLDITQITKCVFLGSLCLKPVPQLFDSPILLEELDMKVGMSASRVGANDENLKNPVENRITEGRNVNHVKKPTRKKCLNSPKLKKKSLREKSESKNVYNGINNVKSENIKLENSESQRLEDSNVSLTENRKQKEVDPVINTTPEEIVFCKVIEPTLQDPTETPEELPNDISLEDDVLELELLNENNPLEELVLDEGEPDNISVDIKEVDSSTTEYDMGSRRDLTPELILIDSDDDAIDQLMYNIMDIKIGPNGFEEKFFEMPPSDIEECEEYPSEYNENRATVPTVKDEATKEKKFIKRSPQCKICSQVFPSYAKLKKHKLTHNRDRPYLCLKCGDNHTSLDQLIAHLRTHQDIEECEEYPSEYNENRATTPTVKDEATKEKKFIKRTPQCKICSQVFPSYVKLKKHKLTHNGDRPYLCLKCGDNHTTLDQLIAHLRTHQGKRPYVCKKCNKGFKTTKALENHKPVHVLKKVVPPKKTFKCEVCGKEFRKLCDLERHTRVHTGEKPSVCNICNRRFQQAHNLNKHLLIHTQEKPYQCDICNKKFGRNDVLNRHLLTHSVKKPNRCETCMKSFIRVSQLLQHKEKYHPERAS